MSVLGNEREKSHIYKSQTQRHINKSVVDVVVIKHKLPCLFRHQTVDLTQPHKRSLTVMELMPIREETN